MKPTATISHLIWTHVSNTAAIAIHLVFLWQIMTPKSLAALVFIFIVAAPPAMISATAEVLKKNGAPRAYSQSLSASYLAIGAWAYYDAIYVHPDPQGGLVFIFVPILGLIVIAIGTAIVFLVLHSRKVLRDAQNDA